MPGKVQHQGLIAGGDGHHGEKSFHSTETLGPISAWMFAPAANMGKSLLNISADSPFHISERLVLRICF